LIGSKLRPRNRPNIVDRFFEAIPNYYNINNISIEDILSHAEDIEAEHIGLTPWMDGEYNPCDGCII